MPHAEKLQVLTSDQYTHFFRDGASMWLLDDSRKPTLQDAMELMVERFGDSFQCSRAEWDAMSGVWVVHLECKRTNKKKGLVKGSLMVRWLFQVNADNTCFRTIRPVASWGHVTAGTEYFVLVPPEIGFRALNGVGEVHIPFVFEVPCVSYPVSASLPLVLVGAGGVSEGVQSMLQHGCGVFELNMRNSNHPVIEPSIPLN
eukprot:1831467-Rhodomonas_salina.4